MPVAGSFSTDTVVEDFTTPLIKLSMRALTEAECSDRPLLFSRELVCTVELAVMRSPVTWPMACTIASLMALASVSPLP